MIKLKDLGINRKFRWNIMPGCVFQKIHNERPAQNAVIVDAPEHQESVGLHFNIHGRAEVEEVA
jgi:hypothetical protein